MRLLKSLFFVCVVALTFASKSHAQCVYDDGKRLMHFYIDTLSKETWNSFELDSAFIGHESFIGNQKTFFDSLGVIRFEQAIKIACEQKGFVVYTAILQVNDNKSKTVWRLEGEEHVKFGGRGPGNATITKDVLMIDATTGKIISQKKVKGRAMVDF